MPKVEPYGQPRVDLRPVSGAKLTAVPSPDVFGAGLGAEAAGIGEHYYSAIEDQARQRADEVALTDFSRQSDEWEHQHLYDPQSGALNTVHGKDALGLSADLGGAYDKFSGDLIATMNPRQQLAAQKQAVNKHAQIVRTLDNYGSAQMNEYETAATNGAITNSQNLAAANATDPLRVSQEVAKQQAIVASYAEHQGLSPDARDSMMGKVLTGTHVGVINQLLASDQDTAAQAYFDAAKGQINGEALAGVQKALEEGSLRGQSQRQSDQILKDTETESDALDQAKAITDPKLRDAVQSRVVQEWALRKQAQRDDTEQTMVGAANLIDKNPGKGVRAIPPSTWTSLSVGERTQLELYAKRNQEPGGVKTDWDAYYTLQRFASSDDPKDQETFANMNLMAFRSKLGNAEFKQMIEAQAAARKKDVNGAHQVFATEGVQQQVIDQALVGIGVNPAPPKPGTTNYDATISQRVVDFRRAVRDAVATREARSGKKLTEPEVQDVVDTLMTPISPAVSHWFSANEPARYAFETPGKTITTTAQIPPSERKLMEDALRRAGRPVTDAALLGLFNAHLQDVRGGR